MHAPHVGCYTQAYIQDGRDWGDLQGWAVDERRLYTVGNIRRYGRVYTLVVTRGWAEGGLPLRQPHQNPRLRLISAETLGLLASQVVQTGGTKWFSTCRSR